MSGDHPGAARARREGHWIRYAHVHLRHLFPYIPQQSGYNKRLRAAGPLIAAMIRELALVTPTAVEDSRLIDSTRVPCGMSRETAKRSHLAGEAGYGYCASHSRDFWGMRLHLLTSVEGMPLMTARLAGEGREMKVLVRAGLAARCVPVAGVVARFGSSGVFSCSSWKNVSSADWMRIPMAPGTCSATIPRMDQATRPCARQRRSPDSFSSRWSRVPAGCTLVAEIPRP